MFSFYFAALGEPFCSRAERADFDAVLGERLSRVSGGVLEAARVRETIDDCAALREKVAGAAGGARSGALGPACHGVLLDAAAGASAHSRSLLNVSGMRPGAGANALRKARSGRPAKPSCHYPRLR